MRDISTLESYEPQIHEYIEKRSSETPTTKKNVIDLGQGTMFYRKNIKDYP